MEIELARATSVTVGVRRALGLALLGASLAGCRQEVTATTAGPLEVPVVVLRPETIPIYAELIGSVDGAENAEIRARVPGYLQEQHYKEGTTVKKGTLLFTIDPVLSQAAVRQVSGEVETAKAALARATADVERLKPLAASSAVSKQELDHAVASQLSAQAQVRAAQGTLETAQANLGYTKVYSPIDGIAGTKKVSIGTLVGQGEPTLLTTVSKLDPVKVRFTISEQAYLRHAQALNRITTNAVAGDAGASARRSLELTLADGSRYPHKGSLELLDREVNPATGTILLEAYFPNPDLVLRPGQYAKVRGVTHVEENALAVPQRAVRESQSLYQVYVVGPNNAVEVRPVTVGDRVGQRWILRAGVKPGERVMLEGFQKVKPGSTVEPREVSAGDAGAGETASAPAASGM